MTLLDHTYPASEVTRIYVVVDNYCIHKAKAVEQWLGAHPCFALLWLPTYCPRATPLSGCLAMSTISAHGNHQRKRLHDLVKDVERHMGENGPWQYKLSQLYDALRSRRLSST